MRISELNRVPRNRRVEKRKNAQTGTRSSRPKTSTALALSTKDIFWHLKPWDIIPGPLARREVGATGKNAALWQGRDGRPSTHTKKAVRG